MTADFIKWAGRQLRPVLDWRDQQRRYRACPQLREIDAMERQARANHCPVRPIQRQRQALMADMLRRGVR